MCLRGEAPQTYFVKFQVQHLNSFDFTILFKIQSFVQNESLERDLSLWTCVTSLCKKAIRGLITQFFQFNYIEQNPEFSWFWRILDANFWFFFKWPELQKYLSDRSEPKCGNGKEHFNYAFSWVKRQNSSYFARYSRELTYGSWLGTP